MRRLLIVTHTQDREGVDVVLAAAQRHGVGVTRFDTDCFPSASCTISGGRELRFRSGDDAFVIDERTAIWLRRLYVGARVLPTIDRRYRQLVANEATSTLEGALTVATARGALVRDQLRPLLAAHDKCLQLALAPACGFTIPRSWWGNDAVAAREFVDDVRHGGGEVISKSHQPLVQQTGVGRERRIGTVLLDDDAIAGLDALMDGPTILQARVQKRREWRVVVIGDCCFGAAVDPHLAHADVDWRTAGVALEPHWQPVHVPPTVWASMQALLKALHITIGAFDLVETPDGEFVFLEVTPGGEWFWLDALYDGAITTALLRHLECL